MIKNLLIFVLIVFSMSTWAISEENYQSNFKSKVIPFLNDMYDGLLPSNNLNLHFKALVKSNLIHPTCLIILPGRTESAEKYAEFVYDIDQTDFGKNTNYFILDHRGQGESDRMLKATDIGYVDSFSNYVSDLDHFLEFVVDQNHCAKKMLFAHSMGAGIALTYLLDHPHYFNAAVISSPMLKIQTKPYPYLVAESIVQSMVWAHKGPSLALGQKGFDPSAKFIDNHFTTSPARFQMTMDLFNLYPNTQLGGASNQWILEVMKGTKKIRSHYNEIQLPMAMYRAGNELYSDPNEMHKFCLEASNCQEIVMATSKHEVVNDRDENRDQVMKSIIEFFKKY